MKFLKKIAVAASFAVIASVQTAAFADFTDMPGGEMGTALQNAVNNGLISGIDENTIAPNDFITRAQMATIITRAFGAVNEADISFPDVSDDAWYRESVKKAVAMSAFKGDENGNFNPENSITFQETYTVLSRVFYLEPYKIKYSSGKVEELYSVDDSAIASFSDKDKVADWAKTYTESVVANGGWKGIDGKLKPTDNITRGEFALIMDAMVETYIDEAGTYENLPDGLTVVRTGGVTIKNFNTDKNLILSYGIDEKGCTVVDSEVEGATIVLGGANPVEKKDPKTGEIFLDAGDKAYIVLTGGHFSDVRTKAPYVSVDLSGTKCTHVWTNKYTLVSLGTVK